MLTTDGVRTLARYSAWQNRQVIDAADPLGPVALSAERGAVFGSIFGTLNHLLWADRLWLSRLGAATAAEQGSIAASVAETPDWAAYKSTRRRTDAALARWAIALKPDRLATDLTWHSGAAGREITKPFAVCVMHFFNHGTHHRGQVHAMLTAAGAPGPVSDLFLLPD